MQPLRLTIYGDYWDSQIYKGRLYLWDMNNAVRVYDWDAFVRSLAKDNLRLPLMCAFARGDLLYQPTEVSSIVFADQDIKNVLEYKFNLVSQENLIFSEQHIAPFIMSIQESPFKILHDDSAIYYNNAYAITDSGLYRTGVHKERKAKFKVGRKSTKIWDGLGTSIQAGSGALAIAASDDGLFEYRFRDEIEPISISKRHTLFANWTFASIYGSSDMESGYLAAFRWREDESNLLEDVPFTYTTYVREFSEIVDERNIFNSKTNHRANFLSWGCQEKLYRASLQGVEVVRFTQKHIGSETLENTPFEALGSIDINDDLQILNNQVVSGGVSYFGVVVEYDNSLAVIESNGDFHIITGPITRWRTFPRSIRYENHLHVILEDRIDIYSFNNDYFVDQRTKKAGIEYKIRDRIRNY